MQHLGQTGYLGTIATQEEFDFVAPLGITGFGGVWLGAPDAAAEGVWRWGQGPKAGELLSLEA